MSHVANLFSRRAARQDDSSLEALRGLARLRARAAAAAIMSNDAAIPASRRPGFLQVAA